jgi:hypothetical protein
VCSIRHKLPGVIWDLGNTAMLQVYNRGFATHCQLAGVSGWRESRALHFVGGMQ